ncbi:MAG: hypothetical protein IPL97_01980 [Niastella sp.]|nr:hypothetical protein [Niastella sp.]
MRTNFAGALADLSFSYRMVYGNLSLTLTQCLGCTPSGPMISLGSLD